jgi:hypothetical protein
MVDLNLVDPAESVLDRVLDRDHVDLGRLISASAA